MTTITQRRYERVPFSVDLEVKNLASGVNCQARSIDLSRGGIGFFARSFMPKGTSVRIVMQVGCKGKVQSVVLSATVMRAETDSQGAIMGAAFERPLSPATQPALCAKLDSTG